jgi:Na+-translocating ferredoxin:NAD+ oxidoreductase RnfG subunit
VLLRGTAPGYGGAIRWLLAADLDAPEGDREATPRIRRLVVTAHQETPGIADFLDDPEHPWLRGFAGRGADVAALDTISGATITTRALARSVGAALTETLPAPAECAP